MLAEILGPEQVTMTRAELDAKIAEAREQRGQ